MPNTNKARSTRWRRDLKTRINLLDEDQINRQLLGLVFIVEELLL